MLLILIALNIFIWQAIIFGGGAINPELYFLNVGQGDSQLINFPGDVQVLIDGGRGPQVLNELAKILPSQDRYLDLVVVTHPDFDHYGGLIDVLKTYQVGAVITSDLPDKAAAYQDFVKVIKENNIPEINLHAGDKISYQNSRFDVLAPSKRELSAKAVNDTGIVLLLQSGGLRALYTADISAAKELDLLKHRQLAAQVLKVSHHGSKYSSDPEFLKAVQPKVAVIGVGKNKYGHPTPQVLSRLADVGSAVLRTDESGTIKLILDNGVLKLYKL